MFCPLNDISVFPQEQEVLFPCFSFFEVLSVEYENGGRVVKMKHIKDRPQDKIISDDSELAVSPRRSISDSVKGPVKIVVKSKLEKEAGIAEELSEQIKLIDPEAEIDITFDFDKKSVFGRAQFSNSQRADRACNLLHMSTIGDRELSVHGMPAEMNNMPIKCRVAANLSAVPYNGMAVVDCGLQGEHFAVHLYPELKEMKGKPQPSKKVWKPVMIGNNQVTVSCYTKSRESFVEENTLQLSRVPQSLWDEQKIL
jgi:hypothetical protein